LWLVHNFFCGFIFIHSLPSCVFDIIFKTTKIEETYVGNPLGHTKTTTTLAWHEACKRYHHPCYHKHNVPMNTPQQRSSFSKGARIINGFLSSMLHEYWKYWNNTKSFFLALKSFALTKWAMNLCDIANCKNNTNNQPTKKHFKSHQVVEIPQFHFESQV